MPRRLLLAAALVAACTEAPGGPPQAEFSPPAPAPPPSPLEREIITDWAEPHIPTNRVTVTPERRPVTRGPFVFSAEATLLEPDGTRKLPEVQTSIRVTNRSKRRQSLLLSGCSPARALGYATADRSDPAWNLYRHSYCGEAPERLVFAPGATHPFDLVFPVAGMLDAFTRQGPHQFVGVIQLEDDTAIAVEAGTLDLDAKLDGLRYRTSTALMDEGHTVTFTVTLRNDGDRPLYLSYGCLPRPSAFRHAGRTGPPVARPDWGCESIEASATLAPGETVSDRFLHAIVPVSAILDPGNLPDANYYFTLRLELNGLPLDLIAGEAVLARPREPLRPLR